MADTGFKKVGSTAGSLGIVTIPDQPAPAPEPKDDKSKAPQGDK